MLAFAEVACALLKFYRLCLVGWSLASSAYLEVLWVPSLANRADAPSRHRDLHEQFLMIENLFACSADPPAAVYHVVAGAKRRSRGHHHRAGRRICYCVSIARVIFGSAEAHRFPHPSYT